jgi:lysozyme
MTDLLLALIRRFEGFRAKAYLCPAGYPTQGYGVRVESLDVPPITQEEGERRLRAIAPRYVRQALAASPGLAENPAALAAIADFCYNLGPAAYRGSTLRKRIDAGDFERAAAELQKWVWGGGRKLPGLVARRAAEASLLAPR